MEKDFIILENKTTLTPMQKENLKDLKMEENKSKYLIFQSLYEDTFKKIVGALS